MNSANAFATESASKLVTSSLNLPSAEGATTVNNNTTSDAITTVSTNDASPTGSDATTLHGADDTPIVNNNTITAAITTVSTNDTTNDVADEFIGKRVAKHFLNDENVEELFRGTVTKTRLYEGHILYFILYDDSDSEEVYLEHLSSLMDMYRREGEEKCFYLSKVDGKYKENRNVPKEEILDYVSSELKRRLFQMEITIVEERFEQLIIGT